MSIIHKILDYDLHKTKNHSEVLRILMIETPGREEFLPCVVSTINKGRFLINKSITRDGKIRSGVFTSSEETLDDVLPNLFDKCYELSLNMNWENIHASFEDAYDYIKTTSGFKNLPHYVFIPDNFDDSVIKEKFEFDGSLINKSCRIHRGPFNNVVFLSRPDFVGLLTRMPNNSNSIIMHNVSLGLSFLRS